MIKANQTAILNKLGSYIKTLNINVTKDSKNGKTYSQLGLSEIEFLFDLAEDFPFGRIHTGTEVAAIPGKGRLFLANVPMIRKGAPYQIVNKKVIVGIEHHVRITPVIQTKEGTYQDGEAYFEDIYFQAKEFSILITEEGDLYSLR